MYILGVPYSSVAVKRSSTLLSGKSACLLQEMSIVVDLRLLGDRLTEYILNT